MSLNSKFWILSRIAKISNLWFLKYSKILMKSIFLSERSMSQENKFKEKPMKLKISWKQWNSKFKLKLKSTLTWKKEWPICYMLFNLKKEKIHFISRNLLCVWNNSETKIKLIHLPKIYSIWWYSRHKFKILKQ